MAKYQVIAAVTTYCYLDVEADNIVAAKLEVQNQLDNGQLDGGDFYTMENEERPGKFEIVEVNHISKP